MRASDTAAVSPAVESGSARQELVVRIDPRTGKLVRRLVEVSPAKNLSKPTSAKSASAKAASTRSTLAKAPAAISSLVEKSAQAHDVDPLLVHSIIQVESNYDAGAVSSKGAEGLMQLMPPTARMLGVSNSFDPGENIEAGVKYLKYLQDLYKDDRLALAAYNAGPGAVDKYGQIPPYPETQKYVQSVAKRYEQARQSSAAQAAAPAPVTEEKSAAAADAPPKEPEYSKLEEFVDEYGRLHLTTALAH